MPTRPHHWNADGHLDLTTHDAPHASADMEQWHVTCHARDRHGADLSIFAVFLRMAFADPATDGQRRFAHAVAWAVSDPVTDEYYPVSKVDPLVAQHLRPRLIDVEGLDPRFERALAEVFSRGEVPLPDRLMETAPEVDPDGLSLAFDECRLSQSNGLYDLSLMSRQSGVSCSLRLRPQGPPMRHGTEGVITLGDEEVHHYFFPDCEVSGRATLPDGREFDIVEGSGWYAHQFSASAVRSGVENGDPLDDARQPSTDRGQLWTWMNIVLTDGRVVSAYEVTEPSGRRVLDRDLVMATNDGTAQTAAGFELESKASWRSIRTFRTYSVSYGLVSDDLELDLAVDACSSDQEFVTALSPPAFWEGRCMVHGTVGGELVTGQAFVIQRSVNIVEDVETLLARVGEVVIAAVDEVLPHHPRDKTLHDLIGTTSARQLQGVDADNLGAAVTQPIRSIVDRGGKAWRSYVLLTCCDAVGGDSRDLWKVLALPEIIHTGSLIIDDIEDESATRRGGPACHVDFGQAVALNAGNAAYFIAPGIVFSSEPVMSKPDSVKLALYDLYFRAMRGAHAGQAMDLQGVHDVMPSAVETGDTRELVERILACYRFKTGVPSACFAAMGAILGDGTQHQIKAVTNFMEAAGVAFQVIDDVLNLTGFEHGRKATGEDILNGTVTLPLARALEVLDYHDRQKLWSMYQSASDDHSLVPSIIEMIDGCDSFQSCRALAQELMEESWTTVEKELEASHATVMLRAFSWFVLERHY